MKRADGSYLNTGTVSRFVFSLIIFALYFAARSVFFGNPAFCDKYCDIIRAVALISSGALSFVKYTVAELAFYVFLILFAVYLIFMIYKMCVSGHVWARILRIVSNIAALCAVITLLTFGLYGAAFQASPISEKFGLDEASTTDTYKLRRLTEHMRDKANEYADMVPRDIEGNCEFGSFDTLNTLAVNSFETAQLTYEVISGPFAPAKTPKRENLLTSLGLSGIYIPLTGEVAVNINEPDCTKVFTMAREMSRRLAIAPEGEANFAAFIVCHASTDRRANYSGYLMAYRSCLNVLSAADPAAAGEVNALSGNNLTHDLAEYKDFLISCEGFLPSIIERFNDAYLRSQGQQPNEKSGDKFVELLIAEYANAM